MDCKKRKILQIQRKEKKRGGDNAAGENLDHENLLNL